MCILTDGRRRVVLKYVGKRKFSSIVTLENKLENGKFVKWIVRRLERVVFYKI